MTATAKTEFVKRLPNGKVNLLGTVRSIVASTRGVQSPADVRAQIWCALSKDEGGDDDRALYTMRQMKTAFYLAGLRQCRAGSNFYYHPLHSMQLEPNVVAMPVAELVQYAAWLSYNAEQLRISRKRGDRKQARQYTRQAQDVLTFAGAKLEGRVH